ncbi:MAG: patatin-like phospholipase family protein [Bacteroidales bacterium]|nr:patatin-like phospholipase family protein [Bacteroidales bacterium]
MLKKYFILGLIALLPFMATGQSVGLVLSGGGSKGLAHIGVIKALEENRIPIDFIGGTSMGAIVGASYAMGMTTGEIMEIIRSDDFGYWMSGVLEEEHKYYFKAEDPAPDILNIGIDLKDTVPKTRLPLSVIPNHLMDFAFMEIFSRASAAAGYDFDSLFIPFLCNAVDISNNREIVFRKGDLSQAVRASMTVPLYFRPIVIDGNILYDGGIYNNFPVQHVEEHFHPDIIIGSKAAEGNTPPDEFDILAQIENIVMKPSNYKIDSEKGILLDMDFKKESLLSFDKLDEFVELGYNTAMAKMDSIKLLISRKAEDTLSLNLKRAAFVNSFPELRFNEFEIEGLNEHQKYYVEQSIRKADSILDISEVKQEYLKLSNDKSLFYIYPHAVYKPEDSLFTMNLRVIPQAPLEARFGLFFSTTGLAQTYLGFSYRQISELSTHLKGSIQFGRFYDGVNLGFRFDYPARRPLFFQGNFSYNGYEYNSYNTNFFFEDLKPSYLTEDEINFRFDVGFPYQINGIIKSGVGIGRNREIYYMNKDFSSTDTSEVSNVNKVSVYMASDRNTLNNKQFATEGTQRILALRAGYGAESYYPGSTAEEEISKRKSFYWFSASIKNHGFVPLTSSFTLGYYFQAEATFKPLLSNYFSTIIDAPVFQPNMVTKGLFMEHYRAHQFLAAGLIPVYNFTKQLHAKVEAYAYFPVQEIILGEVNNEAYFGNYFKSMKTMFHGSLNFVSVAGPVSLHLGYITDEENPWIFQLSFGYLLFNKKSSDV